MMDLTINEGLYALYTPYFHSAIVEVKNTGHFVPIRIQNFLSIAKTSRIAIIVGVSA